VKIVPDRLWDIVELANRLKIPVKTIRNKLSDGTWPIQPLRIGRALRWREADVEQALAELAPKVAATAGSSLPMSKRSP
jgi:predicted DNA-binding transcriptional regulator AlpA